MEILNYVHNNINVQENKILIIGNPRQEFWFDGIFEYKNRNNLETIIPIEDIEKWNENEDYDYLVFFNKKCTEASSVH